MRRIAVIDAETDPFRKGRVPKPFLWGWYNGTEYRDFATGAALAQFLRESDYLTYAHNGGRFDFHYLLDELEAYDDIKIINGRIAQMSIGNCELRDSFLLVPEKLSAYKKDEIDYALFEIGRRDYPVNKRKISEYLQADCRYLWELVTAFIARFGLHLTCPGAAMNEWRQIERENELEPIEETSAEFYAAFAPYYFGGRVECFATGVIDTDFCVYDINSAYARAMMDFHPASADYRSEEKYVSDSDFYRLRCISDGIFPYRALGDAGDNVAGLFFPHDNEVREFTVTGWEYRAAMETNAIRKVKVFESIRFSRRATFRPYVMQFWNERKTAKAAGDKLADLFAKRLLNALYGKFAANPDNYRNYIIVPSDEADALHSGKSPYSFGGMIGPWALAEKPLEDYQQRFYNVATGASITGFVRAMLWRAIYSSEGVLYVDTDSIACEARGSAICVGDALGDWKLEGRFDRAGIAGKKLYIFRGASGQKDKAGKRLYKTASKGVRLTHAELWRVAAGGVVEYTPEVPVYSVHNRKRVLNAAGESVYVGEVAKFINRTVRKTA